MRTFCAPPRCPSRNAFRPSAALWQYFVASPALSCSRSLQLQLYSTAHAQAAADVAPGDPSPEPSSPTSERVAPEGSAGTPDWKFKISASDNIASEGSAEPLDAKLQLFTSENVGSADNAGAPDRKINIIHYERPQFLKPARLLSEYQLSKTYRKGSAMKAPRVYSSKEGKWVLSNTPTWQLPWFVKEPVIANMFKLRTEIDRFSKHAVPSYYERTAREHLTQQVFWQLGKYAPQFQHELFGSSATSLTLALSDIDIRLYRPRQDSDSDPSLPPSPKERQTMVKDLHALLNVLRRLKGPSGKHCYHDLELVRSRYPLISFKDTYTNLQIQLVLSNDSSHQREFIARYLEEYPFLRSTYILIKSMLEVRGLTDVYRGGVGSYPLFMMLVTALKHGEEIEGSIPNPQNSAHAFIRFLHFWRQDHTDAASPFYRKGFSLNPVALFDKYENPVGDAAHLAQLANGERQHRPDYMLSLRDPADPTNDLGRQGFAIQHVRKTCGVIYDSLDVDLLRMPMSEITTSKTSWQRKVKPSVLWPTVVGALYDLQLERRRKLHRAGEYAHTLRSSISGNPGEIWNIAPDTIFGPRNEK